jgi:hypothetical protein
VVHDDCRVSRSIFASGSLSVAGVSELETPPGTTSEPGTAALSASARKVQEALRARGLLGDVAPRCAPRSAAPAPIEKGDVVLFYTGWTKLRL